MTTKEEAIRLSNYETLLKTKVGRDVIWDILSMCGLYFECSCPDNNKTHYCLGRRSVGLQIMATLEDVNKGTYAKLLTEHGE